MGHIDQSHEKQFPSINKPAQIVFILLNWLKKWKTPSPFWEVNIYHSPLLVETKFSCIQVDPIRLLPSFVEIDSSASREDF